MAYNTEVIAILSSGVSFPRLLIPYFISALFIMFFNMALGNYIIPKSNEERFEFEEQYYHRRAKGFTEKNVHRQIEPGVYVGAYRVKKTDMLPHGRIVGHLTSKTGVDSQWIDTLGQVKMGSPTILPAVVSKDTVLTSARSPYLVRKALVILPKAKLTVAPGSVIWFEELGIIVKGELQVLGNKDAPVALGGLGSTPWKGIFFDHSRGKNILQHCSVSGAQYGLRAIDSELMMDHSRFWDNEWGIVVEKGRAEVNRCLFRTSSKSGIAAKKARLVMTESIVTENKAGGVLLENTQATITSNNIANNGNWQLKVLDNKGNVRADNNWWGRKQPSDIEIIGSVQIGTPLEGPIDFSVEPRPQKSSSLPTPGGQSKANRL